MNCVGGGRTSLCTELGVGHDVQHSAKVLSTCKEMPWSKDLMKSFCLEESNKLNDVNIWCDIFF